MSHTSGQWAYEVVGHTTGENPVEIGEVTNGFVRIAEYVTPADGRLIAAAPDMLRALSKIANVDAEPMLASEVIDLAREAVRKATQP